MKSLKFLHLLKHFLNISEFLTIIPDKNLCKSSPLFFSLLLFKYIFQFLIIISAALFLPNLYALSSQVSKNFFNILALKVSLKPKRFFKTLSFLCCFNLSKQSFNISLLLFFNKSLNLINTFLSFSLFNLSKANLAPNLIFDNIFNPSCIFLCFKRSFFPLILS